MIFYTLICTLALCLLANEVVSIWSLSFLPMIWYTYFRFTDHGFNVRDSFLDNALINYCILLTCTNFLLLDYMFGAHVFIGIAYLVFTLGIIGWLFFVKFERWVISTRPTK